MQHRPDETNTRVGVNVAALRGDMSQAELAGKLAKELGKERIDPTAITRLEKGTRSITVNELMGLATVFEVDPMYLLIHNPASDADEMRAIREGLDRCLAADKEARLVAEEWRAAHDDLATTWMLASESGVASALATDRGLEIESAIFVSDEEESTAWAEMLSERPFTRALARERDFIEEPRMVDDKSQEE